MTITLTQPTIEAARVALLLTAQQWAAKVDMYVFYGWADCAAQAAQYAYHYSAAWQELANTTGDN